jgi:hypothetical protein
LGTKITKFWEQKLQESGNKNSKNLGTKVKKIWEQKYKNKNLKNLGNKN